VFIKSSHNTVHIFCINMGRKSKVIEAPGKQRLTLAELAEHDDVCSDVMIDNVSPTRYAFSLVYSLLQAYFKYRIRKYRPKHVPVRGVKGDDIPQILLHKVIVGKDVVAAEKELLKLPGIIRYRKSLRSKAKDEHFLDHLRKYIYMYQTDCPFEVSTTNRYTITNYEAAVTARKRIKQGETIKYLTGTLVPLSTEESMNLDMTNRNFSIVVNARKKSDQMFLGPARFANHDCSPNGRLIMKGVDSMEVKADKNIGIGDEITVSYGENYFGPDNVECLCHTCEVLERNGWTSKAAFAQIKSGTTTPVPDNVPATGVTNQKRKRKRDDSSSSFSTPGRTLKRLKTLASPSKLQYSWTPPSTSASEMAQEDADGIVEIMQPKNPRSETPSRESQSITPKRDDKGRFLPSASKVKTELRKAGSTGTQSGGRRKSFPLSPPTTSSSSHDSENEPQSDSSDTSKVQVPVAIKMETVEKTTIETDPPVDPMAIDEDTVVVALRGHTQSPTPDSTPEDQTQVNHTNEVLPGILETASQPEPPATLTTLTMTKVSTMASIEPLTHAPLSTPPSTVVQSIEPQTKTLIKAKVTVTPLSDSIRTPGDYILTRKLLAQPHDRWVRCHNELCHTFFLQPNGYQTRRECPRCERHSMLYGFPWPKTDPDPRKLLGRQAEAKSKGKKQETSTPEPGPERRKLKSEISPASKYSAYRRQGKCGKGTWVEGGGDDEERVMDHRTIHRFVMPDEEKELTRKGLLVEAEQARAMGEDELALLAGLDGRRARFRDEETRSRGRESSGRGSSGFEREESIGVVGSGSGSGWGQLEDVGMDEEGRRRSNRIVESRVYVSVNMRR
jgi:[histone H4]-N-methyl-L-lysine20 N-methyltransferase